MDFNFSQNIEDNVEEAASGVKGENSVKLFGGDLETLQKTAEKIKDVMATVPGITDLAVFNSLGQPTVRIDVDRAKAARYGLAPGDINSTVQIAIGGQAAGNLYEEGSDRNFPIMVRLGAAVPPEPGARSAASPSARRRRSGIGVVQVPLTDVANDPASSPARRSSIASSRSATSRSSSASAAATWAAPCWRLSRRWRSRCACRAAIALEWVGELGELQSALGRLEVMVPVSLVLIGLLLFLNFSPASATPCWRPASCRWRWSAGSSASTSPIRR